MLLTFYFTHILFILSSFLTISFYLHSFSYQDHSNTLSYLSIRLYFIQRSSCSSIHHYHYSSTIHSPIRTILIHYRILSTYSLQFRSYSTFINPFNIDTFLHLIFSLNLTQHSSIHLTLSTLLTYNSFNINIFLYLIFSLDHTQRSLTHFT